MSILLLTSHRQSLLFVHDTYKLTRVVSSILPGSVHTHSGYVDNFTRNASTFIYDFNDKQIIKMG